MSKMKTSESPGKILHFVKEDDLTDEEVESLWQQGVNMDDWDYMLLGPTDLIHAVKVRDAWDQSEAMVFEGKDWWLGNMLSGSSSNRWYRAKLRGKEWAMGIAYHA